MSTKLHDRLPAVGDSSLAENAPISAGRPAVGGYERPELTPVGNLLELLGKSGPLPDYRNRRFHQKRP